MMTLTSCGGLVPIETASIRIEESSVKCRVIQSPAAIWPCHTRAWPAYPSNFREIMNPAPTGSQGQRYYRMERCRRMAVQSVQIKAAKEIGSKSIGRTESVQIQLVQAKATLSSDFGPKRSEERATM